MDKHIKFLIINQKQNSRNNQSYKLVCTHNNLDIYRFKKIKVCTNMPSQLPLS